MKTGLILGIESSCDETAAAVVDSGSKVLSSLVSSQAHLHAPFRGVVPEIASRAHEAAVMPLIDEALRKASCSLDDLEGIAVTARPGLIGALLVGIAAAKGIAVAKGTPLAGVDHLQAHVHSARMGRELPHPLLALVASGGHTVLFRVEGMLEFSVLGQTTDDAAGEAFDKAAGLLGLPYPGGPPIEKAARGAEPSAAFPVAKVKGRPLHFSFSGVKTALLYHLKDRGWNGLEGNPPPEDERNRLCASFQEAVVKALVETSLRAADAFDPACAVLAGGVAMNSRLRERFAEEFGKRGLESFFPAREMCGDNAAMVAGLGYHVLKIKGPDGLGLDAAARSI